MKNIIKLSVFVLLVLQAATGYAQRMEGVITYTKSNYWTRIYSRLDYLSKEEKDRIKLTWGANDKYDKDMKLVFTPDKSLYTYVSKQGQTEDGRYSWKEDEYVVYRDFATGKETDWIEMLGRVYQVEDSLKMPNWKIMNKIKDIQGHVCMMAVTEDTIKKQSITAWFADDLPVSVGPGAYYGLPGAILELEINEGDVVITANKIEMKPVGDEIIPSKKLKGRKISRKAQDDLIYNHIKDSMKSRRNPYWSMPF
ncbi:hypothetical protein GCM10023091_25930 [Ravibacter arvi]|uniref:GLPGLI family protein n=1 Tax=Ravibacter arvi TaxID=2051041 RepID=A0ABP8M2M9_9BACT